MIRRRHYTGQSRKAGLPPGTLVHTGSPPASGKVSLNIISYSADGLTEDCPKNLEICVPVNHPEKVTWINVEGLTDVDLISRFGHCYNLHPLILEDIVNTSQRPKLEDYGEYIFIVIRMIGLNKAQGVESEQVSMILGPGYLLTFQEGLDGDVFETVRERLRNGRGRIRSMGADYLAYALIDAVVDRYFTLLEEMGEIVEDMEERLARKPDQLILRQIISMKREIIFMRKSIWPLREVASALERGESDLISESSSVFFRDIYDHTIQIIDGVETFRDLLSGMQDLYLSSISNRTNEIMRFLTVIGTIFMPLTFLVGVYGMNFKHIPELGWTYGYYMLWLVMLGISAGMIYRFKKRGWL